MSAFEYREDVEEWLKPMTYDRFWIEVKGYSLKLPEKAKCDGKILTREVEKEFILDGLKYLAVTQLTGKFKLERRPLVMPDLTAVS